MLVLLVMLVAEVVAGVRITASDIFESSLVVTCPLVLLVPTRKDKQITQSQVHKIFQAPTSHLFLLDNNTRDTIN